MDQLYIIVPCYNEEEILECGTLQVLKEKIELLILDKKISSRSRILFVDDGSKDRTLEILQKASQSDPVFSYLSFSRNFGHQSALLAGLFFAEEHGADVMISIDADLQQDINAMDEFLEKFKNGGADIVYGVRNSRSTDSILKKCTAQFFYDFMNLLGCEIIRNHADYRLMSAKAVQALKGYKEVN